MRMRALVKMRTVAKKPGRSQTKRTRMRAHHGFYPHPQAKNPGKRAKSEAHTGPYPHANGNREKKTRATTEEFANVRAQRVVITVMKW